MLLSTEIKKHVRDIPDFPKQGVVFKDITPLLKNIPLCEKITEEMAIPYQDINIDGVACLESRGFWFGLLLAKYLRVPMIPLRKQGKLPGNTISCHYDLEYGQECLEMHDDAVKPGQNILIHDDVLATGGTASAAAKLIGKANASVAGYTFLLELSFLNGREKLKELSPKIETLITY